MRFVATHEPPHSDNNQQSSAEPQISQSGSE